MPNDLVSLAGGPRKPTSRLYTNADVQRHENNPGTTYGEWTDGPKAAAQRAAAAAVSEDLNYDPLLELDRASNMATRNQQMIDVINDKHGAPTAEEGRLQEASRIGPVIKDAVLGAAVPASFLGGPVGPAAMALLGISGAMDFAEDPSLESGAMAGLGLMPVVGRAAGGAKRMIGAAREKRAVDGIRNTYGAGDMGAYQRGMPRPGSPLPAGRDMTEAIPYTPGVGSGRTDRVAAGMTRGNSSNVAKREMADGMSGDFPAPQAAPASLAGLERTTGPGWGQSMLADLAKPGTQVGPRGPMARPDVDGPGAQLTDALANGKASLFPRADFEVPVQRIAPGKVGDEFAGVQPYGPSTKLTPEEELLQEEFWESIINGMR
jgi:hypothetical protein